MSNPTKIEFLTLEELLTKLLHQADKHGGHVLTNISEVPEVVVPKDARPYINLK
jgi:hypothetical protein